jgi:hypothetical protein
MLLLVYLRLLKQHDIGIGVSKKLTNPLDKYGLRNKIKTYIKDESSNLNTMTSALKFVIKCEALGLEENF